ncbi:hypothetical protein QF042_002525 [Pedobacter sp. W3I1]|uniref:IS4 family transposase n=5 Tax=Pedobacter TaxID=84567 RepID=UPI0027897EDC|nr:IS4 family transposase [Pedobacter sp. W3I1]MDQ0638960.1 hypothetical protein [Pedobacter sp. W3I1]
MSTSGFFNSKIKKRFDIFFNGSTIDTIARSSGFLQRSAKKISPMDFVMGFVLSCSQMQNTFSQWAFQISQLSGTPVSKQAVFDRLGPSSVAFAKALLEHVLLQGLCYRYRRPSNLFSHFKRVILQDSTTLHLPEKLSEVFRGNFSKGKQKAVARVQTLIDICNMQFLHFSLGSFTDNDQSASQQPLEKISAGELLIRDLGYFVLEVFEKLGGKGAFFLSRLRFGLNMYDCNGKQLHLKDLLKSRSKRDMWLMIGKQKNVKVRMIMIPLPEQLAAQRIRKAKQDRDRRLNHSQDYYRWLEYTVLITNVGEETWTAAQADQAYRVRWQIEIVFKSWKSGFHLQQLLHNGCTNEKRISTNIYLLLMFICLFMQKIFLPVVRYAKGSVSLIKCVKFFVLNMKEVIATGRKQFRDIIDKYCKYEKRNHRINLSQLFSA